MPESSLTECLRCGYDLTGLPPAHRCPECGQPYDASTRVWRPRSPRMRYVVLLAVIPAVFVVVERSAGIVHAISRGLPLQASDLILALMASAFIALFIWFQRAAVRKGMLIAVTREALHARVHGGTQIIPWEDVETITEGYWGGVVIKRRGKALTIALYSIFDTRTELQAFLSAASELRTQAASSDRRSNGASTGANVQNDGLC